MTFLLLVVFSVLNCLGICLFGVCERCSERHADTQALLITSLLFETGILVIVSHMPPYPSTMRKLPAVCNAIVQFFVNIFILECTLCCFWYPLDTFLHTLPTIWSDKIETAAIDCEYSDLCSFMDSVISYFKNPILANSISMILSSLFLVFALHMARYVDLGIIYRYDCCPNIRYQKSPRTFEQGDDNYKISRGQEYNKSAEVQDDVKTSRKSRVHCYK